ncbi:MAG: hypothetical protein Q4P36_09655 [Bowdeniella nasicola]|nr:hypothetical protein [Bowdeniella nasicola]
MSPDELRAAIASLTEQMKALQARVNTLEVHHDQVPEADLVLIGAAVAAYFGHKAKVRAIRYSPQNRWAAASRGKVHDRSVPHSR